MVEDNLHRYKKKLRAEKQVNEELGRRVSHWKKKHDNERRLRLQHASRIGELEALLVTKSEECTRILRIQKDDETARRRRRRKRRPLPSILLSTESIESVPRSNASTPDSDTIVAVSPSSSPSIRLLRRSVSPLRNPDQCPVQDQDVSISFASPQQCESPKWSSHSSKRSHENNAATSNSRLVTLSESLRSSNASHLIRNVWRTSNSSHHPSPATTTTSSHDMHDAHHAHQVYHQRPLASAFFVAGPSRYDLSDSHVLDPCVEPVILDSIIEDSNDTLPSLVEHMCFPDGVSLVPAPPRVGAPTSSICKLAPISIFCMSVVHKIDEKMKKEKSENEDNHRDDRDDGGPTALYGLCAAYDPSGTLAVSEHRASGTLVHVPLVMCLLTYEASELRRLAKVLQDVLMMEEERARGRLYRLRRGRSVGADVQENGAIHVGDNDDQYGKLCQKSRNRVMALLRQRQVIPTNASNASTALTGPLSSLMSPPPRLLPLFDWGGDHLFQRMTTERCLVLLGCALTEQKIIFVSKYTSRLGAAVLAFVSLLSPLIWSGPLIPILPSHLNHILDAPFPLIAGVTTLEGDDLKQRQDDAVIVQLDQGRLFLPTTVTACYHEYKIPRCDQLSHDVASLYAGEERNREKRSGGRRVVKKVAERSKLAEMASVVRFKVDELLQEIVSLVPVVEGNKYAEDVETLRESNPFLAHVAGTQMCSHWRQHND